VSDAYFWDVPDHFNVVRDVIEPLAADTRRPAFTFVDRTGFVQRSTFAELAGDAARWAHLLRGSGLGIGDRVVVRLGSVPAWPGAVLGAIKSGLVPVLCATDSGGADLADRALETGAKLVVTDRSGEAEVDVARGRLDGAVDVLYADDAALLLARHRTTAPTEPTLWCDEALIVYTSGTSGPPRPVTHSHAATFAQRSQAEHWLTAGAGDLVWCTARPGDPASVWCTLLGPWSRGAEVVLQDGPLEPLERMRLVEQLGVTILCRTPADYRLDAELGGLGERALPTLRHLVSTGEPLPAELVTRYRETLGLTIHEGYGLAETGVLVASTPERDVTPGSMGWPTRGHDVALIDDEGHETPPGVEGEIALRGTPPSLFMRYWRRPEETTQAFRGEWFTTGDRATRDDDGCFWFVGRAEDVIFSAAYRIGPFDVETALLAHPAVADAAVVGKPDPDRGEIVKAFVVPQTGVEPASDLARELQDHTKRARATHKHPREVEFVDDLPRTSNGKVRRGELRRLELTRAGEDPNPPSAARLAAAAMLEEDEAAAAFLRDAAERRHAELERLPTDAESRRLERAEELRLEALQREEPVSAVVPSDGGDALVRAADHDEAAGRAADASARRRAEDEATVVVEAAERRRRAARRALEEERARRAELRSWRRRADEPPEATALAERLAAYGAAGNDDKGTAG
jgi:acetyl-CoA synthetase/medium-chain acyl-CoA synthetase